ncbi:hypothetical protein [Roseitranquillus sediminis]|nr:hypothetical protein [Roseitranquillus sediminis]MBM9593299.1 hypothetical protein [Roseitranquillus sediminis]
MSTIAVLALLAVPFGVALRRVQSSMRRRRAGATGSVSTPTGPVSRNR